LDTTIYKDFWQSYQYVVVLVVMNQ